MNHVEKATMSVFLSPDSAAGGHKKNDILFKMIEGNMSKKNTIVEGKKWFQISRFPVVRCHVHQTQQETTIQWDGFQFQFCPIQTHDCFQKKLVPTQSLAGWIHSISCVHGQASGLKRCRRSASMALDTMHYVNISGPRTHFPPTLHQPAKAKTILMIMQCT
jgi:hypothetical protein